jgi:chorismate synthase
MDGTDGSGGGHVGSGASGIRFQSKGRLIMHRFLTGGESHGPCLTVIVEGFPAGLPLPEEEINRDLARRQGGYGRSGRQRIEHDEVQFLGGVEASVSTGGPVVMQIVNRDHANFIKK